jgi:peptidoglycan L-alanyl-D-glutamate endopeptidase CwlK
MNISDECCKLNERSLKNLQGVHPDLVKVITLAGSRTPFLVTEGLRTLERQKTLVKSGKSKTINSRHLTGHAIDVCDMDGCYDIADLRLVATTIKEAAKELDVKIEWGGDWKRFVDTPHFQLPWKQYPISGAPVAAVVKEAAVSRPSVITGSVAAGLAIPSIPVPPLAEISNVASWQSSAETVSGFVGSPVLKYAIFGMVSYWLICHLGPKVLAKFGGEA